SRGRVMVRICRFRIQRGKSLRRSRRREFSHVCFGTSRALEHSMIDPNCNPALRFLLRRAGSVYTAGPAVEDALTVCERLATRDIVSTVCYWNALLDSPAFVLDSYLRILQLIRDLPCNCYLSIKAPALAFDAERVKQI